MIAETMRTNLSAIVRTYAKAKRSKVSTISKKFYGQTEFFDKYSKGKMGLTIDKYDELIGRFREAWPDDVEWPWLESVIIPPPNKK